VLRPRALLTPAAVSAAVASVCAVPAAAGAGRDGPRPPKLRITITYQAQDGRLLLLKGRLNRAPGDHSDAQLQEQAGGAWTHVARAAIDRQRFTLRWTTPAVSAAPVFIRARVLRRGRVLATSVPSRLLIPTPPVECAPPSPPPSQLPPGDGWVVGGAYIMGGPAPGIDACLSDAYTVTASYTGTGAVAATQAVAGGGSYTLVLPAGSYKLTANGCSTYEPVLVTAGAATHADVDCDVP
jgi:hypothetical protein